MWNRDGMMVAKVAVYMRRLELTYAMPSTAAHTRRVVNYRELYIMVTYFPLYLYLSRPDSFFDFDDFIAPSVHAYHPVSIRFKAISSQSSFPLLVQYNEETALTISHPRYPRFFYPPSPASPVKAE